MNAVATPIHNPILRYWQGRGRLAPLYWGWGVAGSILLAILVAGPPLLDLAGLPWALGGIAVGALYTLWILVSIWRCSGNIEHPAPLGVPREVWGMLARWLTVAWAINAGGMAVMLLQSLIYPALGR
ncbi:hypothetical protein [Caldovatus aquaticus]|uniref:Uncharacterized protein n=1 Tax=Caldovatus aquaticus TaxID=2865671 RepID=A0ABS7F170_9PROT|nr:hypothetical protein [Caldovatus aquaticus]MBW8269375.1 hypothetical protein [Caldovatus aquaticus]